MTFVPQVVKDWAVHDVASRSIRKLIRGQDRGRHHHGIGGAMYEHVDYDRRRTDAVGVS